MSGYIDVSEHFKTTLSKDVRDMLLGEPMGYGTFRHIYNHASDPGLVVKLENGARSFHNIAEHQVWEAIKDTKLAKWFAPVRGISNSGVVLLMERAQPVTADDLPDKVPAFFTDLKAENWGRIGKRFVCVDYGLHLMLENGMTSRMKKANWRG